MSDQQTPLQMSIILPPTPGIIRLGKCVHNAVGEFLAARSTVRELGKYEADEEAWNLFNLVIRNAEAIAELANVDLVLLPAANTLARSTFEIAVKACWLAKPDDPFDREARWLAHLHEEERMMRRASINAAQFGGNPKRIEAEAELLRKFREEVIARLPQGYSESPGNPSVEKMLDSIGNKEAYNIYIFLSAYVHGGHASTSLYRENLGVSKRSGEFISSRDWVLPMKVCLDIFDALAPTILERLGAANCQTISPQLKIDIKNAVDSLKNEDAASVHNTPMPHNVPDHLM